MAGQPWVKFFVGDWRRDPDVSLMSAEARGVWLEFLWVMHEKNTYELRGTTKELARLARCEVDEIERAIKEIERHNVADVEGDISGTRPPSVSVVSRRLLAENKVREYERDKKRRQRLTATGELKESTTSPTCPTNVPLSDSDSDSSLLLSNNKIVSDFEPRFWDRYGKKIDRKKCAAAWKRLSEETKLLIDVHLPRYVAATPDGSIPSRKNPLTYLNGECWLDEDLPKTRKHHEQPTRTLTRAQLAGLSPEEVREYGQRNSGENPGRGREIVIPYEPAAKPQT